MDVSIICVNWNSLGYLRDCIRSIYEHTQGISFEIIVVDNASPERGVESLADAYPDLRIIQSDVNLGFSGANNLGFRHSGGRYVLFLNPDTKLANSAITLMLEASRTLPDAGIVGCTLLNGDLSVSTTSIQKFPTILNQILNIEYLRLRWPGCALWNLSPIFSRVKSPVQVDVIPGACMLMKREVFERSGGFCEEYFMYAEDLDLNVQVRRLGLANYYVGLAEIIHYGGKSSSRQPANQWATIMKYRAMLKLFRKTRGQFYSAAYRIAMGFSAAGRLVVLGLALPFGDRDAVLSASGKWSAVLRWSIGMDSPAMRGQ